MVLLPLFVCFVLYALVLVVVIFITCCSLLGEEVALYCSKYLPDIIKEQKAYKDGKLQKVRCRRKPLQDINGLNDFD